MIYIDQTALDRILRDAARDGLTQIGQTEVSHIEQDISVPVGRDFSGQAVERSQPGEPPRMDTGQLHGGVFFEVSEEPVLDIISARDDEPNVPQILENELNRPYMGRALERLEEYAVDYLAEAFVRHL